MSAYISFQHFQGKPLEYQLFGIAFILGITGVFILGCLIYDKFKK